MATATATASPSTAPTAGDNSKPLITEAELRRDFAHVDVALKEIEKAAEAVPPVFEDDEDLELAKAIAPRLRGSMKRIEELRKQTNGPFDDAKKIVQVHFRALDARPAGLLVKHEAAATVYLRKKAAAEAKRQAQIEVDQRAAAAKLEEEARAMAKAGQLGEAVATQAQAEQATRTADTAAELVDAKPAERGRTTTASGTSTLEDRYSYRIIDKTKIDAFKLFPYLTAIELDTVLSRFVKAGGRDLAGVEIFPDAKARL